MYHHALTRAGLEKTPLRDALSNLRSIYDGDGLHGGVEASGLVELCLLRRLHWKRKGMKLSKELEGLKNNSIIERQQRKDEEIACQVAEAKARGDELVREIDEDKAKADKKREARREKKVGRNNGKIVRKDHLQRKRKSQMKRKEKMVRVKTRRRRIQTKGRGIKA